MHDTADAPDYTGRRRAVEAAERAIGQKLTGPDRGRALDASHPAMLGNSPSPMPIGEAIAYGVDRLDRVDHMLESLGATISRLTDRLEPVLTDGSPATYPTDPDGVLLDAAVAEDRRSTVARRVYALGERADTIADRVSAQERRLEALLDALEV